MSSFPCGAQETRPSDIASRVGASFPDEAALRRLFVPNALGERVRLSGLRRREGLGAVGETVHGAFGRLLLIVFPLLPPPHCTLLRVELAVVIGVDFVEALA